LNALSEEKMSRTDNFRKQHAEILNIAREINALLSDTLSESAAAAIRPLLAKLAGVVSLHLAMEDKSLYPQLSAHADASVRSLSQRYSSEMGSLAAAFGDYMKRWQTTTQMRADPARFSAESKAVFNALSKRIHLENVELYVLVDKLDA
jgi:iron-sulfur cluster repair protein YtfE (RIC family)